MRKFIHIKELSLLLCLNDLTEARIVDNKDHLALLLVTTGGFVDEVYLDLDYKKADELLEFIAKSLQTMHISSVLE